MATKMSILRNFGSEQFSMSVELDHTPTDEEITTTVASFDHGVTAAFDKVCEREEAEKAKLVALSIQREASNKALTDQLDKEVKAATEGQAVIDNAVAATEAPAATQ